MSIKINANEISYYMLGIIIMFTFFPPLFLEKIPSYVIYGLILKYIRFILCVWVIFCFFIKRRIFYGDYIKYAFFMCSWIEMSNIANGMGNNKMIAFFQFVSPAINILGMYYIVKKYTLNDGLNVLLISGCIYSSFVCIANFISQLILKDGLYHDYAESNQAIYVCGNDNSFVFFYLFSAGCFVLYSLFCYEKVKTFALFYCVFLEISMLLADSTTGVAIMLGLNLVIIFSCKELIYIIRRSSKLIMCIAITLLVWILWFRGWDSDIIHYLVYEITNEDMNFTSRGILWAGAVNLIMSAPLLGYGTFDNKLVSDLFGTMKSAHNTYLQILLFGGAPALAFFLGLVVRFYRTMTVKIKTNFFLVVLVSLYLVTFIFEQNPFCLELYFFLSLGFVTHKYNLL